MAARIRSREIMVGPPLRFVRMTSSLATSCGLVRKSRGQSTGTGSRRQGGTVNNIEIALQGTTGGTICAAGGSYQENLENVCLRRLDRNCNEVLKRGHDNAFPTTQTNQQQTANAQFRWNGVGCHYRGVMAAELHPRGSMFRAGESLPDVETCHG